MREIADIQREKAQKNQTRKDDYRFRNSTGHERIKSCFQEGARVFIDKFYVSPPRHGISRWRIGKPWRRCPAVKKRRRARGANKLLPASAH